MAAPTWVGAGSTIYASSPSDPWPTSLTVGTGDLPSGITRGDLVLVIFQYDYFSLNAAPVTVDHFSGMGSFDHLGAAIQSAAGVDAVSRTNLKVYGTWYRNGLFPITTRPEDSSNAYVPTPLAFGSSWRVTTAAWRPNGAYSASKVGGSTVTLTSLPSSTQTLSVPGGDDLAAQFLFTGQGTGGGSSLGSVSTANGFTERHRVAAITGRGGGFVIADQQPSGSTVDLAVYTKDSADLGVTLGLSFSPSPVKFQQPSVGFLNA